MLTSDWSGGGGHRGGGVGPAPPPGRPRQPAHRARLEQPGAQHGPCKYFLDLTNIFRGQVKLRPEPDYHGRTELVLRPVWVSWAGQLEYGEMGPRY